MSGIAIWPEGPARVAERVTASVVWPGRGRVAPLATAPPEGHGASVKSGHLSSNGVAVCPLLALS